jgi:hypothetical protein
MVGYCRAQNKDGDNCDCEEFTPSDDKPLSCAECTHGRSRHPKEEDDLSGKDSVLKVFKDIRSKNAIPPTFGQARAEMLQGFAAGKSTVVESAAVQSTARKPARKAKAKVRA